MVGWGICICMCMGRHLSNGVQYELAHSHTDNELTDVDLLLILSLLLFNTAQLSCLSLNIRKKNDFEAYMPFSNYQLKK